MPTSVTANLSPEFHVPSEIYIRQDIMSSIGAILKTIGSRILLITTSRDLALFHDTIEKMAKSAATAGLGFIIYDEMADSPNTEDIDTAASYARKTHCDVIAGFGGTDSLNTAKAVAVLAGNYLFCEDLFENPSIQPPVALVTIPAFPSFGFEVLPMFFLTDIRQEVQRVYSHRYMFPRATIVDPRISALIDEDTTAQVNTATLSIATEAVISKSTNSLVNTYALKSIDLIFKNLPAAYRDPQNITARGHLSYASVMTGIAFSVSRLSLSLALSLALSSRTGIPVHQAMGVFLPHVMEYNLTATPGKYVQMSKVMDEDVREITVIEAAIKAVEGVRKLEIDLDIPQRLSQFDISKTEFSRIAEIAIGYPFIDNAPRPLNRDEFETILIAAY